jgi:hypothetical protein
MIKDKYYTPKIEEFHVGFEYEYCMLENQLPVWKKDFFGKIINDTKTLEWLYKLGIRVKYLDQEDIESLGFITYDDTTFDKGDLQIRFNCLLQKKGQGLGLIIYNRYSGIIFTGYIKNKSELIKLFKQLDINE